MQRRDLVILVIALGCGIVGFVMILNFLKNSSKPPLRVVAALQALPAGHEIAPEDVALSGPMKNLNAADVFFQTQDILGYSTVNEVPQGRVILRSNTVRSLTAPIEEKPLPVPYGMKSFTISAAEFENPPSVKSGDYVDLLGLVPNYEGKTEMQTLVRSVQVLQVIRQQNFVSSIVLAVTPKAAEILIRSTTAGKLRLIQGEEGTEKIVYQPPAYTEILRGVVREKYKSSEDQSYTEGGKIGPR